MQIKEQWSFWTWFLMLTWWVIGAWFFALPQTVYDAGVVTSIMIISVTGILVTIMHLILAEVSLSIPWHKTFVWIARSLFPYRLWRTTAIISVLNNMIWIIAYIILGWSFFSMILQLFHIQIPEIITSFIYVAFIWVGAMVSVKTLNKRDSIIVIMLLVCIWIILLTANFIWYQPFSYTSTITHNFKVYWLALFALSNINAIPILYHSTWGSAIKTREVIIRSWFTVTLIAILFSLAIIVLTGPMISSNSITWLLNAGYPFLWLIWCIMWLTAIISSHIPVIEHLHEIYKRDWKLNTMMSRILLVMVPFIIILYFNIQLGELLSITWSLLWWSLFMFVCLLNIYLHNTKQKIKIIPMIQYDITRSRILLIVCSIWILYQILTFY